MEPDVWEKLLTTGIVVVAMVLAVPVLVWSVAQLARLIHEPARRFGEWLFPDDADRDFEEKP